VAKIVETAAGEAHRGEDIDIGLSGLEGRNAGSGGSERGGGREDRGGTGFGVFRGDERIGEESYEPEFRGGLGGKSSGVGGRDGS
jgi:hypothetical protein